MSDKQKRKIAGSCDNRRQQAIHKKMDDVAERDAQSRSDAIPPGAIAADQREQVPNNSYDPPPKYYENIEFQCIECGKREVWTAAQQKWYYEVAKGSLFGRAIRCRKCRKRNRGEKENQRQQDAAGNRDPKVENA